MRTLNRMAAIWQAQPRSEKVGGIITVLTAPVLFMALWVVLP